MLGGYLLIGELKCVVKERCVIDRGMGTTDEGLINDEMK